MTPSDLVALNTAIRPTDVIRLTGGVDVYTPTIGGGGGNTTVVSNITTDTDATKAFYIDIPNSTPFQITGNRAGDGKQYISSGATVKICIVLTHIDELDFNRRKSLNP